MPDNMDATERIKKLVETQEQLKRSLHYTLDMQDRLKGIVADSLISPPLHDALQSMKMQLTNTAYNAARFSFADQMPAAIEAMKLSVTSVVDSLSLSMTQFKTSPLLDWMSSFDISPISRILSNLSFDIDFTRLYRNLDRAFLQAMYECNWFPYAGWTENEKLFSEISDIISTSRGASLRRTKRVDKAILDYYTPAKLKAIKKAWKQSELDPVLKRILGEAIDAHLRGQYALTVDCLATKWEGLIHIKTNINGRRNSKKTKEDFKVLIEDNDMEAVIHDFYENMIVGQVDTPEDVVEGVPNRNAVSHSKYKKYPNRKASLNAILLTDFIIGLEPTYIEEE